jgi:hypothetical protein
MECQLVEFLHDFLLTQCFAHPLENKKQCFIKQYKRAKALFNNSGKSCYLNADQKENSGKALDNGGGAKSAK